MDAKLYINFSDMGYESFLRGKLNRDFPGARIEIVTGPGVDQIWPATEEEVTSDLSGQLQSCLSLYWDQWIDQESD